MPVQIIADSKIHHEVNKMNIYMEKVTVILMEFNALR